jgi:hypothetical protein
MTLNYTCKITFSKDGQHLSSLDLANGSGQLGLGSTHTDSGHKTGRPKWVAQPMTHTWSFKGRVKTGLTRIFTHIYNIYIYIYIK